MWNTRRGETLLIFPELVPTCVIPFGTHRLTYVPSPISPSVPPSTNGYVRQQRFIPQQFTFKPRHIVAPFQDSCDPLVRHNPSSFMANLTHVIL